MNAGATKSDNFRRRRVHIGEDEARIAAELEFDLQQAGGEAIGPDRSVQGAFPLFEQDPFDADMLKDHLGDKNSSDSRRRVQSLLPPPSLNLQGGGYRGDAPLPPSSNHPSKPLPESGALARPTKIVDALALPKSQLAPSVHIATSLTTELAT